MALTSSTISDDPDYRPDGQHMYSCLAYNETLDGFTGSFSDGSFYDLHAQGNSGDGFNILGGNNGWFGCRSDFNTNGFTVNYGATSSYSDTNKFIGPGTQSNKENGFNIINTTGSWHNPVIISGGDIGGDGTAGEFAGIYVSGRNEVYISATVIGVYENSGMGETPLSPTYGVETATSGGNPQLITISGSSLGYSGATGSVPINDGAGIEGALRVSFRYRGPRRIQTNDNSEQTRHCHFGRRNGHGTNYWYQRLDRQYHSNILDH